MDAILSVTEKNPDVEQKPPSTKKDGVGYDRVAMEDIDEGKKQSNGGKDDCVRDTDDTK